MSDTPNTTWTAAELRKLPIAERDALLRAHNDLTAEREALARAHSDLVAERDALARAHSDLVALNFRFCPDELAILSCDGESGQSQTINPQRCPIIILCCQYILDEHGLRTGFDLERLSRIWVGD